MIYEIKFTFINLHYILLFNGVSNHWFANIVQFMNFKLVASVELFSADIALEHFEVQVAPLMVLLVAIGNECFPAETALEGFLAGVCPDVVMEGRAMLEDSQATLVWTLVLKHLLWQEQGLLRWLALVLFLLILVEHLHLSVPVRDVLLLNLIEVHRTVLVLRILGLDLKVL